MRVYEALAEAFLAEGTDAQFCLMGDANMHWSTALMHMAGVRSYFTRHEHCACAMAMGHWSATGDVGVASVTCGPGFTQMMTALTGAARSRIPLVIFAGETPLHAQWHNQVTDQRAFAVACGAHYIQAHSIRRMHHHVRDAFHIARLERKPVVLGVPYDLQQEEMPDIAPYETSLAALPARYPTPLQEGRAEEIAARLAAAERPVIVVGRGAILAGASELLRELADRSDAFLGTTLLARGLYDDHPFSLGVVGGFARAVSREIGEAADLVIAFGASLSHHTLDGGRMFPRARILQIDQNPVGIWHGRRVADEFYVADAKLAATSILRAHAATSFQRRPPRRTEPLARRIRDEPADPAVFDIAPETLDPRMFFKAFERVLPRDYDIIPGDGHQAYFHTVMRGGDPLRYHSMTGFGAIGNDISFAIAIAAARGTGRVVLFEGDGSLLMHIQELEVIKRHGVKLLIICCNDGAYGSEIHKLRADGVDDSGAVFGRTDLAAIACGFGLRGATITDVNQIENLFKEYEQQDTAEIWNLHVSDKVISPMMRAGLAQRRKEIRPGV